MALKLLDPHLCRMSIAVFSVSDQCHCLKHILLLRLPDQLCTLLAFTEHPHKCPLEGYLVHGVTLSPKRLDMLNAFLKGFRDGLLPRPSGVKNSFQFAGGWRSKASEYRALGTLICGPIHLIHQHAQCLPLKTGIQCHEPLVCRYMIVP